MNEVSIIINGVRYDSYQIGAPSYPFECGCCDFNQTDYCLDPKCPLGRGFVFKKSDKKFEV